MRQLQNAIRNVVVLHDGDVVTAGDAAAAIRRPAARWPRSRATPDAALPVVPFRDQERLIIETALTAFGGSISRAAAALEISPSTIYRKRQAWGVGG